MKFKIGDRVRFKKGDKFYIGIVSRSNSFRQDEPEGSWLVSVETLVDEGDMEIVDDRGVSVDASGALDVMEGYEEVEYQRRWVKSKHKTGTKKFDRWGKWEWRNNRWITLLD